MSVWCLAAHAPWTCRHAGACCSAGWAIPIEEPAFQAVSAHFFDARHTLRLFRTDGPPPPGGAAVLGTRPDGACVFFEGNRGRLCAIHRELGPASLPVACRQFPRQALRDQRGTLVSLSHYCPTAAELLLEPHAIEIVPAPANLRLAGDGDLEGLDATGALPPLLTATVLTDLKGYDAWERHALALLARTGDSAADAIETIAAATAAVLNWRPGREPLAEAVRTAFARTEPRIGSYRGRRDAERVRLARESVPAGLSTPEPVAGFEASWRENADRWRAYDRTVRAYLAARLFGNWIAYYGRGLATIVEYLRVCLAVLRMEAFRARSREDLDPRQSMIEALRASDLLLTHQSDPRALAARLTPA